MPPPLLEGPLLPKLRGQCAEFLHEGSLARLSLLSSPTCVGLRYGPRLAPPGLFSALDAMPYAPKGSPNQQGKARRPGRPPGFTTNSGSRNIDRVSIVYALRPRLRPRLTLGGRTCPKNP